MVAKPFYLIYLNVIFIFSGGHSSARLLLFVVDFNYLSAFALFAATVFAGSPTAHREAETAKAHRG